MAAKARWSQTRRQEGARGASRSPRWRPGRPSRALRSFRAKRSPRGRVPRFGVQGAGGPQGADPARGFLRHGRGGLRMGAQQPAARGRGRGHRSQGARLGPRPPRGRAEGGPARPRLRLVEGDVRTADTGATDITVAFNFSWWTFKTRGPNCSSISAPCMRRWWTTGLFVLDIYGGSEAYVGAGGRTDYGLFTYVWDQHSFDPVTARYHLPHPLPLPGWLRAAARVQLRLAAMDPAGAARIAGGGRLRAVGGLLAGRGRGRRAQRGVLDRSSAGEADPAWIAYVAAVKRGGRA
jgi:hypothetical protein